MKRQDVIGNPGLGTGEFSEGRDVAVTDSNGNGNASVGESFKDVRIGVEYLDAVDVRFGFEEVCYLRRRWEVVCDGSVVYANGIRGGCSGRENSDVQSKEEDEEEEELSCREFCHFL